MAEDCEAEESTVGDVGREKVEKVAKATAAPERLLLPTAAEW